MNKLPVWATVTQAYRIVWVHRLALLRFAAVPFVLIAAIEIVAVELGQDYGAFLLLGEHEDLSPGAIAAEPLGPSLGAVAAQPLASFLGQVVLIAFLVPWYRLLLLGSPGIGAPLGSWPRRRVYLGMLGLSVLIAVLGDCPLLVFNFVLAEDDAKAWLLLGTMHLAFYFWVVVRLAFLYPAICLGQPWNLAKRWQETAGSFWRLLAAYVVAVLPLLIAIVPAVALEDAWESIVFSAVTWAEAFESFFTALVWLAMAAIWAAVTVVAYATLTGYPAKGVRVPSGPS